MAPVVAPMLGAAVMGVAGWRMIFGVAAVYGVVALFCIWRFLPDTLPPSRRTRLGLIPVVRRYGVILREKAFLTHALTGSFTVSALFAYLAATPQIFIGGFGWSTAGYALLFGVNSMVYIGYNQLNPILVNRYGVARVISIAAAVLLLACAGLVLAAWMQAGPVAIILGLWLSEFGFGLITPCAMVGALSRHQAHAGSASALLGTMQYSGGAVAGLAMGALGDGTARPMAGAMLLCAMAAILAAMFRPRLNFSLAES